MVVMVRGLVEMISPTTVALGACWSTVPLGMNSGGCYQNYLLRAQ